MYVYKKNLNDVCFELIVLLLNYKYCYIIDFTMNDYSDIKQNFVLAMSQFKNIPNVPNHVIHVIKKILKEKNIINPSISTLKEILQKHNMLIHYYYFAKEISIKLNNPIIDKTKICVICSELKNNFTKLMCEHCFCIECANKTSHCNNIICPICKNEQYYEEIRYLKMSDIIKKF